MMPKKIRLQYDSAKQLIEHSPLGYDTEYFKGRVAGFERSCNSGVVSDTDEKKYKSWINSTNPLEEGFSKGFFWALDMAEKIKAGKPKNDIVLSIRISGPLKEKITASAEKNGVTLVAEIRSTLEEKYKDVVDRVLVETSVIEQTGATEYEGDPDEPEDEYPEPPEEISA
jgi:hypothetical protein